jgi:hypothetical protein
MIRGISRKRVKIHSYNQKIMSLLNKDFKTDISSRLCGIGEECSQYFKSASEFSLDVNDNSLILNLNELFCDVHIELSDLNYIRSKFSFLTHLYVNSVLSISNENVNNFIGTPFHIQTDKSINIMNYSSYDHDLNLSNISFESTKFGVECSGKNIKNIKLITNEIVIPFENDINQIRCISGDIKTNIITFYPVLFQPSDSLFILNSISNISELLSMLFKLLFEPGYGIMRDDLTSYEHINPIKLLGIEHYNATAYNFIFNRKALSFTKKLQMPQVKNYIKMADGWYVVFAELR